MEVALEAGADDIVEADGFFEVTCDPADYAAVRDALEAANIEPESSSITFVPQTTVACDAATAEKVLRLIEALEDNDDVQKVYHNAEIPDEVLSEA